MAGRLLLLFIILPLVETWVLIEVATRIGILLTIGLVILTGVVGSQMVRHQGLQTFHEIQACQQRGEIPALPLIEGAILLVCGVMVALPGLITDAVGLFLLWPPPRRALARRILRRAVVATGQAGPGAGQHHDGAEDQHTIEGNYRRDD